MIDDQAQPNTSSQLDLFESSRPQTSQLNAVPPSTQLNLSEIIISTPELKSIPPSPHLNIETSQIESALAPQLDIKGSVPQPPEHIPPTSELEGDIYSVSFKLNCNNSFFLITF